MAVKTVVNEGSSCRLQVDFTDYDGETAVPSNVDFRVDCLTTGATLATWTATAALSSMELDLSSTINAIRNQNNPYESKLVTVRAVYGDDDVSYDEYEYRVKNMRKVS